MRNPRSRKIFSTKSDGMHSIRSFGMTPVRYFGLISFSSTDNPRPRQFVIWAPKFTLTEN